MTKREQTAKIREYLNIPTAQILKAYQDGKYYGSSLKSSLHSKKEKALTPSQILEYLGITKEEIEKAYHEGRKIVVEIRAGK